MGRLSVRKPGSGAVQNLCCYEAMQLKFVGKEGASLAPGAALRTLVDVSFADVLHPFFRQGCSGLGG